MGAKDLYEPDLLIALLADYPQLIPAVAEIRWKEWGNPTDPRSLDYWVDITRRESGRDDLPVTWVAINAQGEAVGSIALDWFDIDERRDRSPWVVGVIVRADLRGQGIGGRMLPVLEDWAKPRGYLRLWVATGGRAVDFYRKCGFELSEIIRRHSEEAVSILSKDLPA